VIADERVYRACAEASWDAPGTRNIWRDEQRETYVRLMLARPDWRALVDVAFTAGWAAHSTLVHGVAAGRVPDGGERA
jgi:hypothetical protein